MSRVFVLGSINSDITVSTSRFPKIGETVTGDGFSTADGGKGANQAVACARTGGNVLLCGCVGKDSFGKALKKSLADEGINTGYIYETDTSTGVAVITLYNGDNTIIVSRGANACVSVEQAKAFLENAEKGDILLSQLETDFDTVKFALAEAKDKGMITVLNPAPADERAGGFCSLCDYMIPNETELETITGTDIIEEGLRILKEKGVAVPVVTLGGDGCSYIIDNQVIHKPCAKVKAVDTTGAGDTFCGSFCSELSRGKGFEKCIETALKCASISVTRKGAQPSIPYLSEIE